MRIANHVARIANYVPIMWRECGENCQLCGESLWRELPIMCQSCGENCQLCANHVARMWYSMGIMKYIDRFCLLGKLDE